MGELFLKMFDTADFPARWDCGVWTAAHGWSHIVADVAIATAYAAIPIVLTVFILRRRDVPFAPIFWMFGAFIFFCGLGHLVEAMIFWNPWYRFSAVVKICTALASWVTVIVLIPTIPKALALPGLATINRQLSAQIDEREAAESKLRESYEELQDFTQVVVEREERMIDLKKEVNRLLMQLGEKPKYTISAETE